MKKGDSHVMWIIIALVIALLFLAVFSFITGGVVRKTLEAIGLIHGENQNAVNCTVTIPGTGGDSDGDGIKDTPACAAFQKDSDSGSSTP